MFYLSIVVLFAVSFHAGWASHSAFISYQGWQEAKRKLEELQRREEEEREEERSRML